MIMCKYRFTEMGWSDCCISTIRWNHYLFSPFHKTICREQMDDPLLTRFEILLSQSLILGQEKFNIGQYLQSIHACTIVLAQLNQLKVSLQHPLQKDRKLCGKLVYIESFMSINVSIKASITILSTGGFQVEIEYLPSVHVYLLVPKYLKLSFSFMRSRVANYTKAKIL